MSRTNLIRQNQYPYHVTTRSNNKMWFALSLNHVWEIAQESLFYANERFPIELHSFVLMNNHYHMILTTPNSDIDLFMQALNKTFSEKLKAATNQINRKLGVDHVINKYCQLPIFELTEVIDNERIKSRKYYFKKTIKHL